MSITINHVSLLTPRVAPLDSRGARLASNVFLAISRLFSAPAPAKLTRAQEAEPVRELAWRVRKSDPGFSADLYAAAARHEGIGD